MKHPTAGIHSTVHSRPRWIRPTPAAALAIALVSFCPPTGAQQLAATANTIDTYTRNDERAMRNAGYVSFGPMPFGLHHTSADVAALLPDEPLLWIETAHFRIGSALPSLAIAGERDKNRDKEAIAKLREELARLAQRVTNVKVDTGKLDPWLRAHLVAQRAEDIYAEVLTNLSLCDSDFPGVPGDDPRRTELFRGLGPYLGMPNKFTILLLRKSTSLQRYTAAYQSWATSDPVRHHDHRFGSAFFGACEESSGGLLRQDLALRTHLTFHVTHNLFTSYRSYGHNLPAWLITGLSHHAARRISTRFPIYDLRGGDNADGSQYALWAKRCAGLLRTKTFEPLATFVERMDVDTFSLDDHLQCWALVDWMMTQHRDALMRFLHRMKDPFHERLRFPTNEELLRRQRAVMQEELGVDAAGLEQLWRAMPLAAVARR